MFSEQDGQIVVNDEKFVAPDSENYDHEILWNLEFDGSVNRLGAREGVWIIWKIITQKAMHID